MAAEISFKNIKRHDVQVQNLITIIIIIGSNSKVGVVLVADLPAVLLGR